MFVDDDEEVKSQPVVILPGGVLVLSAVVMLAEGVPREEALQLVERFDLWSSVSPAEKTFLDDDSPDPDDCQQFVWRLESIWVLRGAGLRRRTDWLSDMCDVPKLVELVMSHQEDEEFVTAAQLRTTAEILMLWT